MEYGALRQEVHRHYSPLLLSCINAHGLNIEGEPVTSMSLKSMPMSIRLWLIFDII